MWYNLPKFFRAVIRIILNLLSIKEKGNITLLAVIVHLLEDIQPGLNGGDGAVNIILTI